MRDDRSPHEIILSWIEGRLQKLNQRVVQLQKQEKKPAELGVDPCSAELKDLGLIRAWLKSQECDIFDELEGSN